MTRAQRAGDASAAFIKSQCGLRRHKSEAAARTALWVIGQQNNPKFNIDKMKVFPCRDCNAWHIGRK